MSATIKYARVEDNIYVGNLAAVDEISFLGNADIGYVINLSAVRPKTRVDGVAYFEFVLSTNEMLDPEIPRMCDKLDRVIECLRMCVGRAVLIACEDGKNLCMLAVGYYLIKRAAAPYASLIERLETLYLDQGQREIELAERRALEEDPLAIGKALSGMEPDDARAYWEGKNKRKSLMCLTNSSFRKLLRIAGGEPQRKPRYGGRIQTDDVVRRRA